MPDHGEDHVHDHGDDHGDDLENGQEDDQEDDHRDNTAKHQKYFEVDSACPNFEITLTADDCRETQACIRETFICSCSVLDN